MLKKSLLFAAAGVIIASITVHAETMVQKAEWTKLNEENTGYLNTLNEACGSKIKLDLNKASFKATTDISNFFWSATEGIANVCVKGDDQKKTVAAKIKTIKMSFGKEKYSFKDGVLTYVTDLGATHGNSAGSRDKITEWIENNL